MKPSFPLPGEDVVERILASLGVPRCGDPTPGKADPEDVAVKRAAG